MSRVAGKRRRKLNGLGGAGRFELLVDSIKDYAIYLLDSGGHVISWNSGARRFKGYEADEILGEHFSRFYTEEDRATGLPERALSIAATEGKFEAEGWRVRKDGTRIWTSVVIDPVLDEQGELIGFAKVSRDITDRKQAQEALFESEQRFRMLVQGVRDYAIYMLALDGTITNWNSGAEAIKGYSADEIVGRHFSQFYTPEDRAAGEPARALQTALSEGKYEREAWRVRKDGSRFWASVLIDPIRGESGNLIGFAKVTRDITERRAAQEAIDKAREELAQAQKMEAIGRLTGGVAHDFNNMLTIIRSSVDLLRRPELADQKRHRYLAAIADTADRAAVLTRQLLTFARRQPMRPELFEVGKRIDRLRQIIATSVGSSVDVSFELDEKVGAVEADPNQFETAVVNIVINARDAMPGGGQLRIRAAESDGIPAIRNEPARPGSFVAVSFEDSGSGIDPETLKRIFEPFFTTKEVSKGTGLGLSQVYGFVKHSGGEVEVTSRPGKGSVFTLYLPRKADRATGSKAEEADSRSPGSEPALNVLLVEDNEEVGAFARSLLTELGQTVTWVTHGRAALDVLETNHEEFDLVFSDVVMPGISGLELAKEISRKWPELPVLLTSGYSEVIAEQGSHGFELLEKPYSAEVILTALRRVVDRRQGHGK